MTGFPNLFFDLDGTLVDSLPGICRSINEALVDVGRAPITDSTARTFVGKPLASIFTTLLGAGDPHLLERVVAVYRDRFDRAGMAEGRLFPGIEAMLRALADEGYALRVVTAKPSPIARRVLSCYGVAGYFDDVHGPTLDDRRVDKTQLVLAALHASGAPPGGAVMIGDRVDDVLAARAHDVHAVAASWGYGSRAELEAAEPSYVADTTSALLEWLRASGGPRRGGGGRAHAPMERRL